MLSIQLFHVLVDERERTIEDQLRIRRLLRRSEATSEPSPRSVPVQADPWRASRPRARATTR